MKYLQILFLNWENQLSKQRQLFNIRGFFLAKGLKTSYSLFLTAEYFVLQEKVSGSFGSFFTVDAN